jgi:regulator of RNase E activity RraA
MIQDIDAPDTGFGAFWGEVQTHVHKGLGCAGVITDGSVGHLDAMAPDFMVLAGSVMPSHAHVHLVDYGNTVSVAGMTVSPNDVIHADRHGAVVIPPEAVKEIPAAVALIARKRDHRRFEIPRLLGRPSAPSLRRARRHSLTAAR